MPAPTRPVAPPQALRSNPDTFSVNAELSIQYQWGALPAWIEAMGDFVQDQADAATAAVLTGDVAPDISKAGNFLRVNAAGTGLEYQQGLSGRNLIINGSGRINQRGYVSGTATSGTNQYTIDRWRVVVSGQSLAFTGTAAGYTMTAPAGGIEQVIEGANIVGGSYVLNWSGTATANVNGTSRAKGEVFTLAAGSNATVRMIGGTFADVQLEAGMTPTPFEHRGIAQELILCQRYFAVTNATARFSASAASQLTDTNVVWPVQMRATPSVSRTGSFVNTSTPTVFSPSVYGARFGIVSLAAGDTYALVNLIAADAEL